MTYRTLEGVTLCRVGGTPILVATGMSRHRVGLMRRVNETAAFLWPMLKKGLTAAEMAKAAAKVYDAPETEILEGINALTEELIALGYLITEE